MFLYKEYQAGPLRLRRSFGACIEHLLYFFFLNLPNFMNSTIWCLRNLCSPWYQVNPVAGSLDFVKGTIHVLVRLRQDPMRAISQMKGNIT